jgi:hypothetical protein
VKQKSAGPVQCACRCCEFEINKVEYTGGDAFYELLWIKSEPAKKEKRWFRRRLRDAWLVLKGEPCCEQDTILSHENCIKLYEGLSALLEIKNPARVRVTLRDHIREMDKWSLLGPEAFLSCTKCGQLLSDGESCPRCSSITCKL